MPKDPQRTVGRAELIAILDKENAGENSMAAILDDMGIYYQRQYLYTERRRLRADFAVWRQGLPPSLVTRLCLIEIVGGVWQRRAHGSIKGIMADIDRLNEATLNDWRLLRFTPEQVRSGYAREILERLLERLAWAR